MAGWLSSVAKEPGDDGHEGGIRRRNGARRGDPGRRAAYSPPGAGRRSADRWPAGRAADLDLAFYTRDIRLIGFVISLATADELADAAATINRHLSGGSLPPRVAEVFDLEQTAAAHARVEARAPGRSVIRIRQPG
jgi:hypothetical protein